LQFACQGTPSIYYGWGWDMLTWYLEGIVGSTGCI
jgi:hypothetical protein